jgi:hypothetical protein
MGKKLIGYFIKFRIGLTVSVMSSNFVNFAFDISTGGLNVGKN